MTDWHRVIAGAFHGPGKPIHMRVYTQRHTFVGMPRTAPIETDDFLILLAGLTETVISLDAIIAIELILARDVVSHNET